MRALWIKGAALAVIALVLVAVLGQIGYIVDERQMRQQEAVANVEQSQAAAQTVIGPILHRQCVEEWDVFTGVGKDRRKSTDKRQFRLAATPQQLSVDGELSLDARYRGLFKVNGYASTLTLQAQWHQAPLLQPQREHAGSRLTCEATRLTLVVSDARGIRSAQLRLNDDAVAVQPGSAHPSHEGGLHGTVPDALLASPLTARLSLELLGTGEFAVVPAAAQMDLKLRSAWPHPSFGGRFLPASREVGEHGFSAHWKVSSLASPASALVEGGASLCAQQKCLDTLAVSLIDPVNPYVLSDRAIKYGLLFITLTFVAVAMVEVLARRRVHPVQYLLVGLALSVFFLLLLSLSEHLSFGVSYAVASAACVLLLGFYGRYMLGCVRDGLLFAGGIGLLYGALFVLLKLEQTALLVGSGVLFAAIALVMVLTRRVNWYALSMPAAD